jgi:hypothetical protein
MPFHRLGFHTLVVWLVAVAAAHAQQPSIDQTFGTWSHKGVVTISGSGFGSKASPQPVVWDDASGGDPMFTWDGAWPNCDLNAGHNLAYRTPSETGRLIPLPHNRIEKYISGAHYGHVPGPQCGYNVIVWKKREITQFPAYSYWSYYQRADDNWTFAANPLDPTANNFKTFAYSEGVGPYNIPNNWYAEFNPRPASAADGASWHLNDDGIGGERFTLLSPDRNGNSLFWGEAVNPMSGRWTKVEIEAKYTNLDDGYFKLWENGVLKINYVGRTDNYADLGTTRTEGIGGYSSENSFEQWAQNNWRYFADVYLDYSRARVILGNAPTFAGSTVREVQVPTVWNDASIQITANLGAFADDQVAYLYVVDENGNVNADGWPIRTSAGGPVADNTPPTVSVTGPGGGGTVTDIVTLTATAADNLGVVTVQFKVDGVDVGGPLLSAPFTVSWNSATEPNGTHVITAVARDLSGNQATSEVTVTTSNKGAPTTKGLVASYSFDDGTGDNVVDDSAHKHPAGSIVGAGWAEKGQHGAALQFDGDDDVVTIPHVAALDLTGAVTVEAWVNPSVVDTNWRSAVLKELAPESVPGLAYGLYATTDTLEPSAVVNVNGDQHLRSEALPANVWTHLAATYDGVTQRLFVNGVEVNSRQVGGAMVNSTGPLSIGGNGQWLEENFAGMIDEVRVYNRALTAAEILVDMKTPIRTPDEEPDPVIFGPETYTGNGRISFVKKTFDVADASGEFALRVTNSGISAAVIAVNDRLVVRPSDFRVKRGDDDDDDDDDRWQRELSRLLSGKGGKDSGVVASIEKGLMLRAGSNQIFTAFYGRPGTSMTVEIVRNTVAPACVIERPAAGSMVREGDRIDVRVNASDNVGVTKVRFESSTTSATQDDLWAPYRASFVAPAGSGQVTLTATAFDAAGLTGTCTTTVNVVPVPPPTVTIMSPTPGSILTAGATIPVSVMTTSDRDVERIDLFVNGVVFASAAPDDAEFLFTVPAGMAGLSFTASATDDAGATGVSEAANVSVVPDAMTTVQGRLVDSHYRSVKGGEVNLSMHGLSAEIFTFDSTLNEMPSLVGRMPTSRTLVSAANWRNPNFVFGDAPFGPVGSSQVVRMTGKLRIDRSGLYTFVLGVNEGGRLMLGGFTVINLSTGTGGFQQGSNRVWLPAGSIPIQIVSFGNGNPEVQLAYAPPGGALQVVPTRALTPATSPFETRSNAAGMFSVSGVPTVLGEIEVSASYEPKKGKDIEGEADPVDPVPGGITNVGLIKLR